MEFPSGLTYNESIIVMLQLAKSAIRRVSRHQSTDRPLINGARVGITLE